MIAAELWKDHGTGKETCTAMGSFITTVGRRRRRRRSRGFIVTSGDVLPALPACPAASSSCSAGSIP